MTEDQITGAIHRLLGLWPTPLLDDDAAKELGRILVRYEENEFAAALEGLTRVSPIFRPNPVEVLTALRAARNRRLSQFPPSPPVPAQVYDQTPYFEQCRQALPPRRRQGAMRQRDAD